MNFSQSLKRNRLAVDTAAIADLITETQLKTGEIPWSIGDKTDPWDHVEAAIGLAIGGRFDEASRAFKWMKEMQLEDGSWFAAYKSGTPQDRTRDTNMTAYVAVGVFYYWRITGDNLFLAQMWPMVKSAINFALKYQKPGGEIWWALSPEGIPDPMALLTGSSSIYMSLKCAIAIAVELNIPTPGWKKARLRLETAISSKPHLFNMTKSRFSMDWFYPILCGAVTGDAAAKRIEKYWKKFVVTGLGVKCVSDEPWVTIAESAELVLALSAMGSSTLAHIVYGWISDHIFDDGSFWCGFTFPDMVIWPEEKIAWTNAVVLMAADALYGLTPASNLFSHNWWSQNRYLDW